MTRQEVYDAVRAKKEAITTLKNEIVELERANCLLCDETQWFTEKMETVSVRENGKKVKREVLVGRIHWIETFKDESTGEAVDVERCATVRLDGKWDW